MTAPSVRRRTSRASGCRRSRERNQVPPAGNHRLQELAPEKEIQTLIPDSGLLVHCSMSKEILLSGTP
jgi:hypothetical protein